VPSKLADRTDDARGDESFGLIEPGSPSRPRRLRMVKQHVRRGCRRTPIAERDPASARISSAHPAGSDCKYQVQVIFQISILDPRSGITCDLLRVYHGNWDFQTL